MVCIHWHSYLFLRFNFLFPGWIDSIHHPFDGEVGDCTKDCQAEK